MRATRGKVGKGENNIQLCSRRASDNNVDFKKKDFKILQKRIMSKIFNMVVQDS